MDAYHRIPVVDRHPEQQVVPKDAGAVHKDRRSHEQIGDPIHCGSHAALVGDVHTDRERAHPGRLDMLDDLRTLTLVEVHDRNREAIGTKSTRDLRADAARSSGNYCDIVC
jgi:hypothetical protein